MGDFPGIYVQVQVISCKVLSVFYGGEVPSIANASYFSQILTRNTYMYVCTCVAFPTFMQVRTYELKCILRIVATNSSWKCLLCCLAPLCVHKYTCTDVFTDVCTDVCCAQTCVVHRRVRRRVHRRVLCTDMCTTHTHLHIQSSCLYKYICTYVRTCMCKSSMYVYTSMWGFLR